MKKGFLNQKLGKRYGRRQDLMVRKARGYPSPLEASTGYRERRKKSEEVAFSGGKALTRK